MNTAPSPTTPSGTAGTGLILLAAGQGSRMGRPKQLLPWEGRPLVRHAAETALRSGCSPVVVVVGFAAEEVRSALADLPVRVADNPDWESGMASSIHAGIRALDGHPVDSLILTLADQPRLTPEIYDRLVRTHRETGASVVTSEYAGTVGVPVLFGRQRFADLLALQGTQGCKGVILAHRDGAVGVPCPEAEFDVDTPADYARLHSGPGSNPCR